VTSRWTIVGGLVGLFLWVVAWLWGADDGGDRKPSAGKKRPNASLRGF